MSHVYESAALRIMDWLHHAERDLIGKGIIASNGDAGTVKAIKLDEHHGLCFTLDKPNTGFALQYEGDGRKWSPVSTIKQKDR